MTPLTPEERARLADWLEAEAAGDALIVEQLERIGSPLVADRRREIDAERLVARKLRAIERF